MNVLHVTTNIGETDILRREFSTIDSGLRVECAGTAREAIERLRAGTSQFHAVLVELSQLNGEGLSLVSEIRKHNLPVGIVAVTSARDDGLAQEAFNGGADHVVAKGGTFLTRLHTVLAHAVERRMVEARLRVMLETAPVCLMRVADDGTILAMNLATLGIVDANGAEQVVDQSWYERVVPEAQAPCRDLIERAAHGERGSLECEIEGLSGTRRRVLMHAVNAPADASGVGSALVSIRDLAKIRGLEAGLESEVAEHREQMGVLETALSEAEAQNQRLVADHEAERIEWQQRSSTDLTSERAAREQAETDRRALVDQQMLNDALDRALAARDAQCRQLTADHEAERAERRRQLAAAQAPQVQEISSSDCAPIENGRGHGHD